jgi:hypothetical protein
VPATAKEPTGCPNEKSKSSQEADDADAGAAVAGAADAGTANLFAGVADAGTGTTGFAWTMCGGS